MSRILGSPCGLIDVRLIHGVNGCRRQDRAALRGIIDSMSDVTEILNSIEDGDPEAVAELLSLVYDELRQLAAARMAAENPGHTLQATALVHEAYLRLVGTDQEFTWDNRGHFFAAAAEAMRRILIDLARSKKSKRHGGTYERRELREDDVAAIPIDDRLLDLDVALTRLATVEKGLAQLVELRFFAGMTVDEAAAALRISPRTAKRNWAYARAWLRRELDESGDC